MHVLCWALTPQGVEIARRLAHDLHGEVWVPKRFAAPGERTFERLPEAVEEQWAAACGHVFVAAAGIVVRCIAPLLKHKSADPAVVVCDQNGRFAVSLLSGHLGQANALAQAVSVCLNGQAVITTATDCAGLPSFDVLGAEADCAFADLREARAVSAALLEGKYVIIRDPLHILDAHVLANTSQCRLYGSDAVGAGVPLERGAGDNFLAELGVELWAEMVPTVHSHAEGAQYGKKASQNGAPEAFGDEIFGGEVVVSLAPLAPRPGLLRLHPRRVHVGVGCRKGTPGSTIEQAVRVSLALADITPLSVVSFASASIKAEEPGLHDAAQTFGVALRSFSADAVAAQPVPNPSRKAASVLGVSEAGVCEAAALLSAGEGGKLLLPKQIFDARGRRFEANAKAATRTGGASGSHEADSRGGIITVALAYGPDKYSRNYASAE